MFSQPTTQALAAALVADGCSANWLISTLPTQDPRSEVNRLVDLGFLHLALCPDDGVRIEVCRRVVELVDDPHLGPLTRAWAALHGEHRGAHPTTRPLTGRLPEGTAHAILPLPLYPGTVADRAISQRPIATFAGARDALDAEPPASPSLPHARWVPFRAPLVLAWPDHAVFQPVGSESPCHSTDARLASDLTRYAATLHSLATPAEATTLAHVVHQLRLGVTDSHAARRLGISERHYRRLVASVMQSVSATSRWQAAARIEAGRWDYLATRNRRPRSE